MKLQFHPGPARHIPLLSVQWINSWWWVEELPETCRVLCRSKFVTLVHLVGFIINKFVTMQHGQVNVKFSWTFFPHDADNLTYNTIYLSSWITLYNLWAECRILNVKLGIAIVNKWAVIQSITKGAQPRPKNVSLILTPIRLVWAGNR
jgi:hypothetical protein